MSYRYNRGFSIGPVGFLILANVLVFIAVTISPRLYGVLGFTPATFLQEPWTIFTSMFVHAGIGHILGNMITLYFFGTYLISLIGEVYFWYIYIIGGLVGNLFYLLLSRLGEYVGVPLGSPFALLVGASGAVFAVGGALTALRPNMRVFVFPIPLPIPLWVAVLGGFLILSLLPSVAWQAHLGGLLFGLIMGFVLAGRRY